MFFNWFSSSFMLYGIALNWQGLTGVDWNINSMIDNNRKQVNIANSAIIFLINHWSVRIGSIGQSGPGGPGSPGGQWVQVIQVVQVGGPSRQCDPGGQDGPGDQACQCIWFTWS